MIVMEVLFLKVEDIYSQIQAHVFLNLIYFWLVFAEPRHDIFSYLIHDKHSCQA